MNKKLLLIICVLTITVVSLPSSVIADTFGDVACTYYGFPLSRYICSDYNMFFTYDAMYNYYVPPATLVDPPYTFVVSGATSNSFNVQP